MSRIYPTALVALWLALGCSATTPNPEVRSAADEIQVGSDRDRYEGKGSLEARALFASARDVLDRRCAVCHGCYDAPCQLKLDSYEGLARGGSAVRVYDATRLSAADPTRLFVDALGATAWRDKDFHAVLPEGDARDPRTSLLLRMLALKRAHPMPQRELHERFSLELDREQSCPNADDFDDFSDEHPYWGMPYAMPGLTDAEEQALLDWVKAGAPYPGEVSLSPVIVRDIAGWEALLNQSSVKAKLAARYLFEHLFLASLYFPEVDDTVFFRLVRSRTPPGVPVAEIATRRPFDDPGEGPLHYRFVRRIGMPLEKTHMPYALDAPRMARYRELFFDADYDAGVLPSYEPELTANPFKAFAAIPAKARYRFLLDDAQFTLMNFIKGPVCRGQVALNVIQERFWIAFIDPDVDWVDSGSSLLASDVADMPAEDGSDAWLTAWTSYQSEHARYVEEKGKALRALAADGKAGFPLDIIWDGDGKNANAALTVLRHFDSASVIQGFVGGEPKTMWVIDFPVLERIHYLLAAGFDVFGNVSHQVMTRLYMDFVRMEAERNFLMFLPPTDRRALIDVWYQGIDGDPKKRIYTELDDSLLAAGVRYETTRPKHELLAKLAAKVASVRSKRYELSAIEDEAVRAAAEALAGVHGPAASLWPEVTFIAIREGVHDPTIHLTVLRDSAHTNIADLFREKDRRLPKDDGLTVLRGLVSAYPNLLLEIERSQLGKFVERAKRFTSARGLRELRPEVAVERTSERFWDRTDRLHEAHWQEAKVEAGLFDFSRLELPPPPPAPK